MARLTASDMIDIVRDCLGGETTETLSDARILRYINESYLELAAEHGFPQLQSSTTLTTASGTASYEVTVTDISRYDDLEDDTNNLLLYRMSEWQYRKFTQGNASSQSGTPVYWFVDGVGSNSRDQITFWPTPAGIYTINVYYQKVPAELVTTPTATSAVIRQAWDDSIMHRAVSRGWRQLGDLEAAGKWLSLAKANDRAAKKVSHEPSHIQTRPGSVIGRALRDV
jgi:hypothetical protein